jgi:hypothetical protein
MGLMIPESGREIYPVLAFNVEKILHGEEITTEAQRAQRRWGK